MALTNEIKKNRKTKYPVHPLLLSRWSPRAFTRQKIPDKELMTMFEAARWAPSSFNSQQWRFIYAKRGTKEFKTMLNLMDDKNRNWAVNASALVVTISKNTHDYKEKPSVTHSFDTGAAWENLALQASSMGWVAHGAEGFDYKKAKTVLKIPKKYTVEMMIGIGKRSKKKSDIVKLMPKWQKMEHPNKRRPLKEIIMKGKFKKRTLS